MTLLNLSRGAVVVAFVLSLASVAVLARESSAERDVRATVEAFYAAFNAHSFEAVPATDDWEHINPVGGTARGRAAVLKELHDVHSTFLKGVTDRLENLRIRFPNSDTAIAVATSLMSTYVTPDGTKHETERHIRTFVVVQKSGRWLIEHDQNTTITPATQ
jgi:uncharacterized protein (TIGR02246 family)